MCDTMSLSSATTDIGSDRSEDDVALKIDQHDMEDMLEASSEVVTIFDWDDTLLPSWHITHVVEPCTVGARDAPLAIDSPFYEPLRRHAEVVAETLRAAASLGRVAIVTLSKRGWVPDSAARFLPGLDIQQLVDSLDIPIYYATEHVHSSVARLVRASGGPASMLEEGVDLLRWCKRSAMEKFLRTVCRNRHVRLNVISVGDSSVEQDD